LVLVAGAAPPAAAPIHVDELRHGSVDRMVVWLGATAGLTVRRSGDTLLLAWPGQASLAVPEKPVADPTANGRFGQWILNVTGSPGKARITLATGAHPRLRPWANRLWIDVDASQLPLRVGQYIQAEPEAPIVAPSAASGRSASIAPVGGASVPHPPMGASPPGLEPTALGVAGTNPPGGEATGNAAGAQGTEPQVVLLADNAAYGGPSVLFPAQQFAAASFTRAGELHLILDAPLALDLSPLKDDPAFGTTTERLLPDGADFRLRPPPGTVPSLSRRKEGWVLTLRGTPDGTARPIGGSLVKGILTLAAASPGRVVAIEDEPTGQRLLVGTQHVAGQRVVTPHASAEFLLLASWQGVVVQPVADRLTLRDTEKGFELATAEPPGLAATWPDGAETLRADGQAMTRRFDLPGLAFPVLRRRLAAALRDAALAPRAARAAPRLRVAQAMLALGLDHEAEAALQVAAADDPAMVNDPTRQGLGAIAAWLAERAGGGEAAPAAADLGANLGDSDEGMLWRALWSADTDPDGAAATLAARWKLLLDYPENPRRLILPAVARALAKGHQDGALDALLAAFPTGSLDRARADRLAANGHIAESLALLDRLAAGWDRQVSALAAEDAVEQRLATHQISPRQAADALDQQIYAWRGGARELRVRTRIAELRAQDGAWRPALALLRETEKLFPEAQGRLHAAEIGVVGAIVHSHRAAGLNALDLVALADEASTLLGQADVDTTLAPLLADRLTALDLPDKAEPILRRLMDRAAPGTPRASIGLRLAGLAAERGQDPEAIAVLDGSGGDQLEPGLGESRAVLKARLLSQTGHRADALAELGSHASPAALELAADIREAAHDWQGAADVLQNLVAGTGFSALPAQGQRDVVLRAVRDCAEASDMAGLRRWRNTYAKLFAGQPNEALFAVLTAEPVQRVGDLPRSGKELGAMRRLPAALGFPATGS
jgi:hypothetical protein